MGLNKTLLLFWGFLLSVGLATAQAPQRQWVFLKDKGAAPVAVHLSPKAQLRHAQAGLFGADADLRTCPDYRRQLEAAGVKVHGSSRWLNALSVETALDLVALQAICPAVVRMQPVARLTRTSHDAFTDIDTLSYGNAQAQIAQLGLDCLHGRGYTGEGMLMAVLDAGFFMMDSLAAFDSLWLQGRVAGYYDFVNQDTGIFDEHNHGMNVASTIVAHLPGQMVGAAPHVTLAMARTESVFSETHQEEDNWLMAMEWADSMGVDIIHTSLGYSTFNAGQGDYDYLDMNGDTSIIVRAADMAAARGILVVCSAGNEGASPWQRITTPCDGDSVLCVGAVDGSGNYVSFSGKGPSADGRVKPDVAALGFAVASIGNNGQVGNASGTSFAAPLVAGLSACLWQAHPQRSNMEVLRAIQQSAHRYATPDSLVGHGIPDACKADSLLSVLDTLGTAATRPAQAPVVHVFPNPSHKLLSLQCARADLGMAAWSIVTADGRVAQARTAVAPASATRTDISIEQLGAGLYFLRIELQDGSTQVVRVIKE